MYTHIPINNPYYNSLSSLSVCLKSDISETTGQKFLILSLFEMQ